MNFFKSSLFSDFKLQDVLALNQDDEPSSFQDGETPASSDAEIVVSSDAKTLASSDTETSPSSDAETLGGHQDAGIWGIGTLVKSIALRSEGMLQTYRKDLGEFGSGLRKETKMIAEVAAHAVKDLPTSLETGASIAQESIESVGQVIENFSSSVWRGTADIIAQGKDAVLRIEDDDAPAITGDASSSSSLSRYDNVPAPLSGGKYSRFEAQVRAMQHDSSTYCEEPDDLADYIAWKSAFSLPEKKQDIDTLLADNTFLKEIFIRFVPEVVSEEIFWTRYFYRLHKLQQTEEARADLVKRATALDEEDLSWDIEDEVEEGGVVHDEIGMKGKAIDPSEEVVQHTQAEQLKPGYSEIETGEDDTDSKAERSPLTQAEGNVDNKDLVKATPEDEDDLGWEVAEDVEESSSNDGKRSSNSEASWEVPEVPREDIQRKFAAQEQDEEDLSWDVDDGDDDAK